MRNQSIIITALALAMSVGGFAAPRTTAQMETVARQAINAQLAGQHRTPRADAPSMLRRSEGYTLMGYADGAFAVVANDDLLPAVLGCSLNGHTQGRNDHFEWWLQAVDEAAAQIVKSGMQRKATVPDATKYPTQVGPLMTTRWDQESPYNKLMPTYASGQAMTGCAATAMAQVLAYHQWPEHGIGSSQVLAPNGQTVKADFSQDYYQWDLMLDDYTGDYTDEQAMAVAVLMRDLGVASKMNYKSPEQGSGAHSEDVLEGLQTYFGFEGLQFVERENYSEAEWMDMVYGELYRNGPIFYGGYQQMGGHAFVLHGYRADGFVYVNWGWSGDSDGYYDISLLNPKTGVSYALGQDMIIGVKGEAKNLETVSVTTVESGQLASLVTPEQAAAMGRLVVSGPVGDADFEAIRAWATEGQLSDIDLTEAILSDNALPAKAFFGCKHLRTAVLPATLSTIGDGAFAYCSRLKSVTLPQGEACQFEEHDHIIYNKEHTELIAVLPSYAGELKVERGVTDVHPWAMAGCQMVSSVELPASVETLGTEAMSQMASLKELRVAAKRLVELTGDLVFSGLRTDLCALYVRRGYLNDYKRADQWSQFENIEEYGYTVKVTNASRKYGEENPKFGYKVTGGKLDGTPAIVCDATPQSPAGNYVVTAGPGTITEEAVDYTDGKLVVKKAPLSVAFSQAVYTRCVGEENPVFELRYDGLLLDDDPSCIDQLPTVVTTATAESPMGEYLLTLTGGTDDCYDLSTAGAEATLVVSETSAIGNVAMPSRQSTLHDMQGRTVKGQLKAGVYICEGKKLYIK